VCRRRCVRADVHLVYRLGTDNGEIAYFVIYLWFI
jgi:hypothetical protein